MRHVTSVLGIIRRGVLDWLVAPRRAARYWRVVLSFAASQTAGAGGRIPTTDLRSIVPTPPPVTLVDVRRAYGDVTLDELVTLATLASAMTPAVVFEIGTFEGGTTLQLAANTTAKILTLDLPPGAERVMIDPELDVYPDQPGWRVHRSTYAPRVEQLLGDSRTFDFAPWYGAVDMVFVDGAHHYENARSDSREALKLCPRGLIVWHDYASYAGGVRRALDELAQSEPLMLIAGTSLVVRPPIANDVAVQPRSAADG